MKTFAALIAAITFAGCATGDSPSISIAWDGGEGVRYLLSQGCIPAVTEGIAVKTAIDRGSVMSRMRTLDASPINDPPGTPAHALLSSASVIMTGTPERCRIAAGDGEPLKLREAAFTAIANDPAWVVIANVPGAPSSPDIKVDAHCKVVPGGTLALSFLTAEGASAGLKFQAIVSRSKSAVCSLS